jgi:hypothetical protein
MSESWPQVIREALKLPSLLTEIYGDLLKPGVKQVGQALESVVGLGNTILWPITLANERARIALANNLERFREKMSKVAAENVVPASPEIGVPVAEKLGYVADPKLSELYLNLLVSSSIKDTLDVAHPSFVHVIENLSPDEATLLEAFAKIEAIPYVRSKAIDPATHIYRLLRDLDVSPSILSQLRFADNVDVYLHNLSGLGIVKISETEWLPEEPQYIEIINAIKPSCESEVASDPSLSGWQLKFDKCTIALTAFGVLFLRACHARDNSSLAL